MTATPTDPTTSTHPAATHPTTTPATTTATAVTAIPAEGPRGHTGVRTFPVGRRLAIAGLVLGAGGNTAQPVFGHLMGGRPDAIADQIVVANEHTGLFAAMTLTGTLAVPLMLVGFLAAAHALRGRARRTANVAATFLSLGMFGFMAVQTVELLQFVAMTSTDGAAAATWMQGVDDSPLLGAVFGAPFMLGCVLGMLTLTIGMLVKGGVPRWIPASWLAFIVLDFSIGGVGPVDPHWLYFLGAVGLAVHIARQDDRSWANA